MRFTSRDPVKGKQKEPLTLHKYLYCLNDPINRVDLSGKTSNPMAAALMAPIVAGHGAHALAIAFVYYGVVNDNDIGLKIGFAIEQSIGKVMALAATGVTNLQDALVHALKGGKSSKRDGHGAIKNKFKMNNDDFNRFKRFMHKWKQEMKIKGRNLSHDELRECFDEYLWKK
jgi:hypothetical protein